MSLERITWQRAESLTGQRLDRRRAYFLDNGHVCDQGEMRGPCSGCHEGYEYEANPDRGHGCSECGFHGVRVFRFTAPIDISQCDAFFRGDPGPHTLDRTSRGER